MCACVSVRRPNDLNTAIVRGASMSPERLTQSQAQSVPGWVESRGTNQAKRRNQAAREIGPHVHCKLVFFGGGYLFLSKER